MKSWKSVLLVAVMAAMATASSVFAAGHNSIVDIASSNDSFDTLVAAVVAADLAETLDGTTEYTVFAPTDDAFAKLGLDENNIATAFDKATLTDILLYHVVVGEVNSDVALTLAGDITMANGAKAGLKVFDGNIYINDDSKVILANVDADNGVIHAVDTVILGPWPKTEAAAESTSMADSSTASTGNTIVDIAVSNGSFDTLVAAVVAAGLADTLSGTTEFTVFAPTDAAFAKLGLNKDNIAKEFSAAQLRNILLYHVLVGEVNSDTALTAVGDITMANGAKAGLKAFEGNIFINDNSQVILADVDASNGVIHVVDTVILDPWPAAE